MGVCGEEKGRAPVAALLIIAAILAVPVGLAADEAVTSRIFSKLYPQLEQGLSLVDQQKELPESAWFRRDKRSKQKEIDLLLDRAVAALELPEIQHYRKQIESSEEQIQAARGRIAEYQRLRLTAPRSSVLGMDQLPMFVTKKGYDARIARERETIRHHGEIVQRLQSDFLSKVLSLGVDLTPEQFEVLLSTVNGNDYLELALAFETVKGITVELQRLTRESGEDVRNARRYYGMYTVLLRLLDFMQREFMKEIEEQHLPKLEEFKEAAHRNVREAREALHAGGEKAVLEQNIRSNELTIRALDLYRQYLEKQKLQLGQRNQELGRQILTADNTYNTVLLASEVVRLLQSGVKNFEALHQLSPPELAGFQNQELKEEFEKLTGLMRSGR